jgi:hypothetical protein
MGRLGLVIDDMLGKRRFQPQGRHHRIETSSLTWNLPPPEVIAAEIVEDLEAAPAEFAEIAATLGASQREVPE